MGFGPVELVSLAEARDLARDARRLLLQGIDPIEDRRARRQGARLGDAKTVTFRNAAARYIASHEAAWRNEKRRRQWTSSLETYAYPLLGDLPVTAIYTALVMQVLDPIWRTKPETAGRVRGRIEAILSWATVRGSRAGENPAQWRGHLDQLLPARRKVRRVRHHAAMDWRDVPAFVAELRGRVGTAARALEYAILTAGRTGEVLGARWVELDLAAQVWIVPAERMKSGRQHRVPLSSAAIACSRPCRAKPAQNTCFPARGAGDRSATWRWRCSSSAWGDP